MKLKHMRLPPQDYPPRISFMLINEAPSFYRVYAKIVSPDDDKKIDDLVLMLQAHTVKILQNS